MDERKARVTYTDLAIITVTGVAGIAAMRWILSHPDWAVQVNMRACQAVKRFAQAQADLMQKVADNAGTRYNSLRNISV